MRNNFTLKTIFLSILFLSVLNTFSQERTCGMEEYMEEQMQNPEFAREYQENQVKFKAKLQEILANEEVGFRQGTGITIPVAVHFPSGNEADRACLVTLAQNQIDILNADYAATNSDISLWAGASASYPGTNIGPMDVTFCLAVSNHPTGLDPELIEGEPCVTIGYNFGGGNNTDSNWAGYMNFVVRPLSGGILGFSPLGGSVSAGQAVTIDDNAFGSNNVPGCAGSGVVPSSPFDKGRTTTHELGHFYNLEHPFSGSCGTDDGIADTPNISDPTYGCPAPGTVAACNLGEFALSMNYMDYTNDACMYMFTAGQATVAQAYLTGVLQSQFVQNVCNAPDPGFAITANDSPVSSCPTTDTEAVFNLTYTTILGFNETTTFSATGLPAGATVSFSPSSLNATGNFTMTVGNLGSTALGEYTITVSGTSTTVTDSVDVLLKNTCTTIVCDNNPSPPNLNIPIVDGSGGTPGQPYAQHTITVPDLGTIESVTVNVDITHTWISDLIIRIIHPSGAFVDVWNGNCSGGYENLDITFDDLGSAITCADPTTGTYTPLEALSAFNGLDAQGDWTILIADFFAQDTGQLNDWAINICTEQPLSVNDYEFEGFALFPNPNNGSFTVNLNSISQNPVTLEVFDIRGRSIYRNVYNNVSGQFSEEVNLNNVKSGMYLVNVTDGQRKVTKKIIVE